MSKLVTKLASAPMANQMDTKLTVANSKNDKETKVEVIEGKSEKAKSEFSGYVVKKNKKK